MRVNKSEVFVEEGKWYKAEIVDLDERDGDYGTYVVFKLSTQFGDVNYLCGVGSKKLGLMIKALELETNENNEYVIDSSLLERRVLVSLRYTDEGYLRVENVKPFVEESHTFSKETKSKKLDDNIPDDIPDDFDDDVFQNLK